MALRASDYRRVAVSDHTPTGLTRSQYEDFMRHVFTTGVPKHDRTGTGTVSVFGYQMRFDLSEGFPLVTTKKVHFPSAANELLWFLRGEGNVSWLQEQGVQAGVLRVDARPTKQLAWVAPRTPAPRSSCNSRVSA